MRLPLIMGGSAELVYRNPKTRHVSLVTVARFAPPITRGNTDIYYRMLSRIEPTIPPTTPPSTVCLEASRGIYGSMACASFEIGSVCSQIRPGPVREARNMPSPPKIIFLMPGTVVIWKETLD